MSSDIECLSAPKLQPTYLVIDESGEESSAPKSAKAKGKERAFADAAPPAFDGLDQDDWDMPVIEDLLPRRTKSDKLAVNPKRSLVADSSDHSDVESPDTKRRKVVGPSNGKTKKPRVGPDGLTAVERKEAKAAAAAVKKILTSDNKIASRRETLHELTIEIAEPLARDSFFGKLLDLIESELKGDGSVRASTYRLYKPTQDVKLIRFLRTANKYRDETQKQWVRYPDGKTRSALERTVILFMKAKELDVIVAEGKGALARHVHRIKQGIGKEATSIDFQVFLMIEGLAQFAKDEKNRNARKLQAEVRGEDYVEKSRATIGQVSSETLELELLRISVVERVHVIRTAGAKEIVRWLVELSTDISFRPYKWEQRSHLEMLGIDGTSKGSSKAGDLRGTFIAQLAALYHVSKGQAEAIVAEYPTWRQLYEAYERCATEKAKRDMLIGIDSGRLADGRVTAAKIGKVLSNRIYTMLHSREIDLPMDKSS